ncbi:MAG: hypothetical protein R2681_03500 [Pyrinomonadaceae bacterium]
MRRIFTYAVISVFTVLSFSAAAFGQSAGDTNQGDEGRKVIRIGVVMPKVELVDANGEVEPGAALRNTYAALINGETVQLVALDARLTTLAIDEAAKKECDFILNLSLVQEIAKSGGGGLFGKIARDTGRRATWEAASSVPYGGGTGERIARTTAQSAIINSGYTMSNMSYKVKKSDKFVLDYLLTTAKGATVIEKTLDAKAKKNNDDKVLLGLIEESANDIVSAIRKP